MTSELDYAPNPGLLSQLCGFVPNIISVEYMGEGSFLVKSDILERPKENEPAIVVSSLVKANVVYVMTSTSIKWVYVSNLKL